MAMAQSAQLAELWGETLASEPAGWQTGQTLPEGLSHLTGGELRQ